MLVINSVYENVWFAVNGLSKKLLSLFFIFIFSNSKWLLSKILRETMFFLMDSKGSYALSGIYLLKVNNRSTRTRCEVCPKLPIKTLYFTPCSSVSMINFEQVITGWDNSTTSKIFLIYKLLTLKRQPFSIFFLKFVWKCILFLYFF